MHNKVTNMINFVSSSNNIPNKSNMIYQLKSICNNLSKMFGNNLVSPSRTIINNFQKYLIPISQKIQNLDPKNISANGFYNDIININTNLTNLYNNTVAAINNYNMNNNNFNNNNNNFNNFNGNNRNMNNNMMNNNMGMMNNMMMNNNMMNKNMMNNNMMNNNMGMMNNMMMNNNMMNMNNMNMMSSMEIQWQSLSADEKKKRLNNILSCNGINILLTSDEWNHQMVDRFINNATYADVSILPSFLKDLVEKPLDKDVPDRYVLRYKDGKLCFLDNEKQCTRSLMPLLGRLVMIATNDKKLLSTIPNLERYSHLIETVKKC